MTHSIPDSDLARATALGVKVSTLLTRATHIADEAIGRSLKVRMPPESGETRSNRVIRGTVIACTPARLVPRGRSVKVLFKTTIEWKGCTGIAQTRAVLLDTV